GPNHYSIRESKAAKAHHFVRYCFLVACLGHRSYSFLVRIESKLHRFHFVLKEKSPVCGFVSLFRDPVSSAVASARAGIMRHDPGFSLESYERMPPCRRHFLFPSEFRSSETLGSILGNKKRPDSAEASFHHL